ncbi:MAG: methyltransferase-like protein 9 [Bacteroidia bacterium]|jgi:ribosomal protein L11 methylase PrmA|nr:methyltransferase-like protein 9 [Bacteroidia bacterium]
MSIRIDPGSFRDRDGVVFFEGTNCYRTIHNHYSNTWDKLEKSGLYRELVEEDKLIPLEPCDKTQFTELSENIYKIYKAPVLPFISYPGEWSFSQLKKAALLTLYIQKKAIEKGFCLKDASAYNVQFIGNKTIFIDSLSFDIYEEEKPWQAYAQFCRHFLAPLLLSHYGIPEAHTFFLSHMDGIPLQTCSKLLPWKSRFHILAYTHIHLHAKLEKKHAADRVLNFKGLSYSRKKMLSLIEHLEMEIKQLIAGEQESNWTDYYDTFSYHTTAYAEKTDFVKQICASIHGKLCLDLGANNGAFTFIAAEHFEQVLACDADAAVLRNIRKQKKENVLTLQVDLNNPLPAYGWNSNERASFMSRAKQNDLTLALALMHHLCIGNNLPFEKLAEWFSVVSKHLIIEFVPKEDEQVKKLLVSRKDIFEEYNKDNFEKAFSRFFDKAKVHLLSNSERVMYYFIRKASNAKA